MDENINKTDDLLVDLVTGRIHPAREQFIRNLIEQDPDIRARYDSLKNAMAALNTLGRSAPPEDLLENTLQRVRAVGHSIPQVELARTGGGVFRPTFSMVELGAIAAMILVMAGILIPSFINASRRAEQSQCGSQLGQVGTALQTYALNHEGSLPGIETGSDRWLGSMGQEVASNSAGPFKLLSEGYINRPVAFQCPSVGGRSFALKDDMEDFPEAEHISYSYHHSLGNRQSIFSEFSEEKVVMADQTPLFANNRFRSEFVDSPVSENHGSRGQNVLYLAGNVSWSDHPEAGVQGDNIYLIRDVRNYRGNEAPSLPTDTFLLPSWNRTR